MSNKAEILSTDSALRATKKCVQRWCYVVNRYSDTSDTVLITKHKIHSRGIIFRELLSQGTTTSRNHFIAVWRGWKIENTDCDSSWYVLDDQCGATTLKRSWILGKKQYYQVMYYITLLLILYSMSRITGPPDHVQSISINLTYFEDLHEMYLQLQ